MLTSDLLVTRISKGKIEPAYAYPDQENLEIVGTIIDVFQRHVGKTYGELASEAEGLEGNNFRFIRGLAQILERRCLIERDSAVDPVDARRLVFDACGGLVTSMEERGKVLENVSERLSIGKDELEKALWSDLEENMVIKEFQSITPESLLRQYNLSLTQTLLFKASGMEIRIEDNYQQMFMSIKRSGLMYSIQDGRIYLDGPISLFKHTEKYGTAFARLLPTIMASRGWSLKASIIRKTYQGKRIYDFTLDHTKKGFFDAGCEDDKVSYKVSFDSSIEKEFYQLGFCGWTVRREPTVLKAGQYAFIPDFSLERNGTRIYVEIVGFWTPEYLKNKIWKINQLKEKDKLILLVNRSLACSGSEFKTDSLIFYDRKIPYLDIIKILRVYEEKQLEDELARLRSMDISIGGGENIIGLDDLAERHKVSLEAVREHMRSRGGPGYVLLGDQLVSDRVLRAVEGELKGVKKHDYALEILKSYGIRAQSQALRLLGYKVKWSGLDPENAEIVSLTR